MRPWDLAIRGAVLLASLGGLACRTRLLDPCEVASVPVVPGAPAVWPSFGGGRFGRHRSAAIGPDAPRLRWSWSPPAESSVGFTPSMTPPSIGADGTVYLGAGRFPRSPAPYSGSVIALDGDTGALRFESRLEGPVGSTPAVGLDGTLYVLSGDGRAYALDGVSGDPRWATGLTQGAHGYFDSSPAIGADGTVYLATEGHHPSLVALHPASGCLLGSFALSHWSASSPAVTDDGRVYLGASDGAVHALDPGGRERWSVASTDNHRGSPAVGDDGTVYAVIDGVDGTRGGPTFLCLALDPEDGRQRWRFATPQVGHGPNLGAASPALGPDGSVYLLVNDYQGPQNEIAGATLHGLDGATGRERWSYRIPSPSGTVETVAVDGAGTVYLTRGGGGYPSFEPSLLVALDGADGRERWSIQLGDYGLGAPSIGADGTIYVTSRQGMVFAVGR